VVYLSDASFPGCPEKSPLKGDSVVVVGRRKHLVTCLQAFRKHQLFDPLCEPGTADLTADVDFKYLTHCVADKGMPVLCAFCFSCRIK